MEVLCWLAAFYVNSELYEKASEYFKLASKMEPNEIKWSLMVASCYRSITKDIASQIRSCLCRRAGLLYQAFDEYERIHRSHPDSVECLRFLVSLCEDVGSPHRKAGFEEKLRQAESNLTATTNGPSAKPSSDLFHVSHAISYETPLPFQPKTTTVPSHVDDWGHGALGEDLLPL